MLFRETLIGERKLLLLVMRIRRRSRGPARRVLMRLCVGRLFLQDSRDSVCEKNKKKLAVCEDPFKLTSALYPCLIISLGDRPE
jgi:hypothetical protein